MVLDSLLASLASAEGPFVLEVLTSSCSLASATEVRLPVIRPTLSLSSLDQGQSLSGSVDPLAHLRASHGGSMPLWNCPQVHLVRCLTQP